MARSSRRRPTLNGLAGAQSARVRASAPLSRPGQPEPPRGLQPPRGGRAAGSRLQLKCAWAMGSEPPGPAGALRAVTLAGHRGSPAPPTTRRPLTSVWAAGNGGCWGFSLPRRPLRPAGQRGAEGWGGGARRWLSLLSPGLSRLRQVAGLRVWRRAGVGGDEALLAFLFLVPQPDAQTPVQRRGVAAAAAGFPRPFPPSRVLPRAGEISCTLRNVEGTFVPWSTAVLKRPLGLL